MKILVLVNEDFEKMALGKNTTLAYILAAAKLGHDIFIYKISEKAIIPNLEVEALHLNKNNALSLIKKYQEENKKIVDRLLKQQPKASTAISLNDLEENKNSANNKSTQNHNSKESLAGEFCAEKKILLSQKQISLSEINFVIQRIEPMKAPFPPIGQTSINDFLPQIKNRFPANFIFNFPINAYADKELPLALTKNYNDLATPTAISFYGDLELPQKLQNIATKYSEIFATTKQKIVFKPDDSAQALGVFAIEIKNSGLNLSQLKTKTIAELTAIQLYEINIYNDSQDVNEIINILCFIQFCKTKQHLDHRNIGAIDKAEIIEAVNSLYGKKILMQPFLEGVRLGDIRINLAKMSDSNFKVVGAVFRKSLSHDEKNFTTCLTTGASKAEAVANNLSEAEEKNLIQKIKFILQQLNHDKALKHKYREVVEIGCDFLVVGNSKDVFWGEANHYCQALMPLSEALEEAQKTAFYDAIDGLRVDYDGGLAIVGKIIEQQISLALYTQSS